jgi:peptidyl-prolyl cis-trans isomerase B (cyclophilin B)
MLVHPHPYVRVTAATALADSFAWVKLDSLGRARLADTLAAHLADPDGATRGAAARALLLRQGESAWPRVQPLLADSSVYVRVAVLEATRKLRVANGLEDVLAERMRPTHPLFERMTAADVLGERRESGAARRLREALADTSLLYVSAVVSGLGNAGDTASVPALVHLYVARNGDAEPDARIAVLDALKQLGATKTADSLERMRPWKRPPPAEEPAGFEDTPREHGAVIHTSKGDIEWTFYAHEAPQTVRNFVRLAKRGYFDGAHVHRVVPNFVVQDGDPTGTGSGGPGYTIRCEYNMLHYDAGAVGMALSGKDTGGSQWFITHSPQLRLDGRYTIFAHVVKGMDVVDRIVQGDRIAKVDILE